MARVQELLQERHGPGAGTTILVIDDSATFRDVLRRAFESAGHRVVTASTGEEGLRAAGARRPDAIVVDGVLPGIDGATVIRHIRLDAALRDVPCLLLTASGNRGAELRALDAGADTFVRKEEDLDVILAKLAAVLRRTTSRTSADEDMKSVLGPKKILADDLLNFSRLGRTAMATRHIDLNAIVSGAIRELTTEGQKPIVWRVGVLPAVDGDPSLLRLAFVNLLSNAIKYSSKRERPEIEVDVAASDDRRQTVVFVRDNGVGFDMTYAHKLFGVFQRLHTHEEFEGTGIGLANVRRIVARHGGRVWAESVEDAGATFYVSLPAALSVALDQSASGPR